MANNDKGLSGMAKAGIGAASMAALAAAAAGAYFFYGSDKAGKNRKMMKSWAVKAKGEMMERLENIKDLSEENYEAAVNEVMNRYKKLKGVDPAEVAALARELKGSWDKISKMVNKSPKRKSVKAKKVTTKQKAM